MGLYRYKSFTPQIDSNCYMAPGSQVIGRVILENEVSIWHNAVLRGDVNQISVKRNSNVQDLCLLHVTEQYTLEVEENVTLGHHVTLHGCKIGKNSLIGMGAIILDGAQIGEYSIVAAGSLVPPHKSYPSNSLIVGSPAKVKRELNQSEIDMLNKHYKNYIGYAQDFKSEQVELLKSF
jgi:carbonic anhydrase/acetyltransferase-like protein (isoleucine patch superfamily)